MRNTGYVRIEVEDIAVASVKFKSGAIGIIEGNTAAYPGFYTRLDIYGSDGSVIIQSNKIVEWKLKGEESADAGSGEEVAGAASPYWVIHVTRGSWVTSSLPYARTASRL